jgi:hypothetical protein
MSVDSADVVILVHCLHCEILISSIGSFIVCTYRGACIGPSVARSCLKHIEDINVDIASYHTMGQAEIWWHLYLLSV